MFCTFQASDALYHDDEERKKSPSSKQALPRRRQVWRACDWCRVHRVKCDLFVPCQNCQKRGAQCTNRGDIRNLPQAFEEIERLRLRVKGLEAENAAKSSANMRSASTPASIVTPESVPSPQQTNESRKPSSIKKHWQGVYSGDPRTQHTSYYGPSSTLYFLTRISSFLGRELRQPQRHEEFQPISASKTFARPETSHDFVTGEPALNRSSGSVTGRIPLSRAQEESFLSLFWQFHFCTLPIIDEEEFRLHYHSLWETSASNRKPSALVDIVLALCMQYGRALMPGAGPSSDTTINLADATIAGGWLYHRCQAFLSNNLESPSIMTVQCHIFTVVYLYFASFQNKAHITMSLAVRSAQTLGLHLEPPLGMPHKERELRKRIWWVMSTVETKICMKLGRPFSFSTHEVTCPMLTNDFGTATQPDSALGTIGTGPTWMTYMVHCQELVVVVREIYESLHGKFSQVLTEGGIDVPYEDPNLLEVCAEFLMSKMEVMQSWIGSLPAGMKTKRRGDGLPFSLDRSALSIETSAPLWLQRQRLCLELMYNGLVMSLYRPFITFSRQYSSHYPTTEAHAMACINHAIAHTYIMHQVFAETDLFNGWHDAFQWQWDATVTLLGFLLAYPISPSAPTIRRAVHRTVEFFEWFGSNNVAVARNAADITRNLMSKADLLTDRFRVGFDASMVVDKVPPSTSLSEDNPTPGADRQHNDATEFWEFIDLALTVDTFNSFEDFLTESCEYANL